MVAVSVVIPTHDRRAFLPDAIESVLAQTLGDVEVIVVDDGSRDDSAALVRERFGERVRLARFPDNRGRSAARNHGWSLARAPFVAFLDSDDIWRPDKLTRQLALFADPTVGLVHGGVAKIDRAGRLLAAGSAERARAHAAALARGYDYAGITETWCMMYTSTVVVRRGLLEETGGFDPALSDFEDWDLFWRVAFAHGVATVPEVVAWHRQHEGNTPQNDDHWLTMNRKHLALLDASPGHPCARRARRNLLLNLALGEHWKGRRAPSRRWMARALLRDPRLLLRPDHPVWGGALLHALLPAPLARAAARRLGID